MQRFDLAAILPKKVHILSFQNDVPNIIGMSQERVPKK